MPGEKAKTVRGILSLLPLTGFIAIGLSLYIPWPALPDGNLQIELDADWISVDGNPIVWQDDEKYTIIYSGIIGCSRQCPKALHAMSQNIRNGNKENALTGDEAEHGYHRYLFLITDRWTDIDEARNYMNAFPGIETYITTHEQPANQLRRMKFAIGIQNP